MLTIREVWHSKDRRAWRSALDRYWSCVKPANLELEKSLDHLDLERISRLDAKGWYDFLRDEYFRWKYTAPNRYATTRRSLEKLEREPEGLTRLDDIRVELLDLDPSNIRAGLASAKKIPGLGIAGASGLLALMYPAFFGTVDQFIVKALREVGDLPESDDLAKMNPVSLTIDDAVTLIRIMAHKSAENNHLFEMDEWTPRKIDKILWTYGR